MGRRIETIPTATMEALVRYHWPGNVRELQNVIERTVILSPGQRSRYLSAICRPQRSGVRSQESEVGKQEVSPWTPESRPANPAKPVTLADAEREHIVNVFRETGWVVGGPNGAAARLGIKRSTLQWKMKKLDNTRTR
jgi:transcriptional regulator with GAF, ATPase, and Fis domain